jgi:hypothetical protein
MQWSDVFDRLGRLESAIFAILGFVIAYVFDLARETRQRDWDSNEQKRQAQRDAIGELQVHVTRVVRERAKAAILDKAVRQMPLEGRIGVINEPWFEALRTAERGLLIVMTRIDNQELYDMARAVKDFPADYEVGNKTSIDAWRARYAELELKTLEFAGELYRELDSAPPRPPRRLFRKRV